MDLNKNSFKEKNNDHIEIKNMLINRDIQAFTECSWEQVQNDFEKNKFYGINAKFFLDPEKWCLTFPTLKHYKNSWLQQAYESSKKEYVEPLAISLSKVSYIHNIEINANKAAVWKKFDGTLKRTNGIEEVLSWQTIYMCKKINEKWKIISFVGYLPLI